MKTIRASLIAVLLGLSVLWLLAEAQALGQAEGFFAWRNLLVRYTGTLAIGTMSAALVLAARPSRLEDRLHGLDRMYRLHRWLGIAGLVMAVAHWLCVQTPIWLLQADLLPRASPGRRALETHELLRLVPGQRALLEQIGAVAYHVAVLLILLALVRRFPYRHFYRAHRWLAAVYLMLMLHSVGLMEQGYWSTALGAAMTVLLLSASAAAVISLLRRVGADRKAIGVVERVDRLDGVHVGAVHVLLESRWAGHVAGQFAFVTFDHREGAHPFTIASDWRADGRLLFLIKALGDYTSTLVRMVKPGDTLTVEGPYGRFDFDGPSRRQIWIGAGIGIAPFVARMNALASAPDGRTVDLFHTTREVDETALQRLADDAHAAGVRLHLLVDARDGQLTGERLRAEVPDWMQADIWFCGPAAFGRALHTDLHAHGLAQDRFHQELFEMR